ncbi:hypothetical protein C7B67_16860 [filamentous cyanobacterium Phorm 6]|nr:hypothetical protein C7B67_16860 [filamentous cyanobacterium Phorm 6]
MYKRQIENNLIKGSKIDPVLLLISLSSLCELIKDNEGYPINEDPLLTATRNLVVHGLVDRSVTVTPLNERLGTNQNVFKFRRNNPEYMELVREANLKLLKIITHYIEDTLLRDRERA